MSYMLQNKSCDDIAYLLTKYLLNAIFCKCVQGIVIHELGHKVQEFPLEYNVLFSLCEKISHNTF
jgi:hypothetical protein